MAPTPSSKFSFSTPSAAHHQSKTPQSKHRLNFHAAAPSEHPVEVVGRIRDHPEQRTKPDSALEIVKDGRTVRVRTEIGYRDFTLDGVSQSEEDDLDGFYSKFVESRINGVKLGQKCTIMMYGPTGSGKSHTMFGCTKQPGIVYNALKGILGDENGEKLGLGTFVQVTILEIYNEEIYDLLCSSNNGGGGGGGGGGFSFGWPKTGSASKVKLEVMGKKAKNASFISGNEAGKIVKEIQKVEKRRTVKSTLCNERSSRSHCMIILDVPTVGGRLMLVDMAGSENIEQAGQIGFEAKMQTGKINQGNIALKRVVESIANGDSHVPFRDSKLTMLLQDSFEDDESKILMILCASPDLKELHKTVATLEYGAKAKCIVRGSHTPLKDKGVGDPSSALNLGSRVAALDQIICKLQMENEQREKERNEALKELKWKEEEVAMLRERIAVAEGRRVEASEEIINLKVNEQTQLLRSELQRKVQECQKMADEIVEMERQKTEERLLQQQQEVEMLRRLLENMESELHLARARGASTGTIEGGSFMRKLLEACSEDSDMVKSMDLDKSIDLDTHVIQKAEINANTAISGVGYPSSTREGFTNKAYLTTVYEEEEDENENEDKESLLDDEVRKEVIEEKKMINTTPPSVPDAEKCTDYYIRDRTEPENPEDAAASRWLRIQNIFTLCGNYRELSQHSATPIPSKRTDSIDSDSLKENSELSARRMLNETSPKQTCISNEVFTSDKLKTCKDLREEEPTKSRISDKVMKSLERCERSDGIEVHVKWDDASKENPPKACHNLKAMKDSTLADLRKLIEIYLGPVQHDFTFLLGDPSGSPISKENESKIHASKLPILNNQAGHHLACLQPVRSPFSPLENNFTTPNSHCMKKGSGECFSPETPPHLSSTPFVTVRRQ